MSIAPSACATFPLPACDLPKHGSAAVDSERRTHSNLQPLKIGTAERARGVSDDARRMKAQARPPGRGIDDEDEHSAFNCGDSEAFRSGQVEVAFERLFAAPELVGPPDQASQRRPVIGDDGADRLPGTPVIGT